MHADPRRVERVLELLDALARHLAAAEAGATDFGAGIPLHRAETHAIRVLGRKPGINLATLAAALGVTAGAASQLVSRLVRKGLARKSPSRASGRGVVLQLTDRGWQAYEGHERFHEEVLHVVHEEWAPDPNPRLDAALGTLEDILDILSACERRARET